MLLYLLDDVLLLNLPLESAQSALNGLAFLKLDFRHSSAPPSP
jgi:hypothetical protein